MPGGCRRTSTQGPYPLTARERADGWERASLDCGCPIERHCRCSSPPLSKKFIDASRDAALHIWDTGMSSRRSRPRVPHQPVPLLLAPLPTQPSSPQTGLTDKEENNILWALSCRAGLEPPEEKITTLQNRDGTTYVPKQHLW